MNINQLLLARGWMAKKQMLLFISSCSQRNWGMEGLITGQWRNITLSFTVSVKAHNSTWGGRDFKHHPVPTPCHGLGCQPLHHASAQAAQGPSTALSTSRDGASTALWSAVLSMKHFSLTSHLNLPSFSLKPFPLVLSLSTHVKSWFPSCL